LSLLRYIILAFVQAATEFLPVSSSGHLLFYKELLLNTKVPIIFDIVVHVGSLTAIIFYYWRRLIATVHSAFQEAVKKQPGNASLRLLLYILISTVVTVAIYLGFQSFIDSKVQSPAILPVTFLITTVILVLTRIFHRRSKKDIQNMPLWIPVLVGILQGLAIFPGISRSGATISPLLINGAERKDAAFYSFFLAIPAILGALVYKLMDVEDMTFILSHIWLMLLCLLVSAAFSFVFLAVLNRILKRGGFWLFSVYTLVMAILSLIIFL